MTQRRKRQSSGNPQRSLWVASVQPDPRLEALRGARLTPEHVARIRRQLEQAAARDPFTSDVPAEVLRRLFD